MIQIPDSTECQLGCDIGCYAVRENNVDVVSVVDALCYRGGPEIVTGGGPTPKGGSNPIFCSFLKNL